MGERAKPIYGWAIKMRGVIDLLSISDSRDDLIATINRPAGQSVVCIRISEVAAPPPNNPDQ